MSFSNFLWSYLESFGTKNATGIYPFISSNFPITAAYTALPDCIKTSYIAAVDNRCPAVLIISSSLDKEYNT